MGDVEKASRAARASQIKSLSTASVSSVGVWTLRTGLHSGLRDRNNALANLVEFAQYVGMVDVNIGRQEQR